MRGQSRVVTNELIYILIAAVLLLGLFVFLDKQFETAKDEGEDEACRTSILAHEQAVKLSDKDVYPEIKCEARMVEASTARAQTVAEELKYCWDRWQQGRVELYANEGTYCNPCSIITFEGDSFGGLYKYLAETKIPDGNETYWEYLFTSSPGYHKPAIQTNQEVRERLFSQEVDTSKKYAVVFYYDKNHSMRQFAESLDSLADYERAVGEVARGGIRGAAIGAGSAAAGMFGGVLACTALSLGACLVPGVAATALVAAGTFVGAAAGGYITATSDSVPYPEWLSSVVLIPHEGPVYRMLGCEQVSQRGVRGTVNGAENLLTPRYRSLPNGTRVVP